MPDLHEPIREHMKQEPPDELVGVHGHDLAFVVVGVIAPPEGDLVVLHPHDPVVADRDPVGVSAEILKNAFGSVERRFAVDDPLLLVQIGDQGIESPRRRKMTYGAGVNEFVRGTALSQVIKELSPKQRRHDFDGEEEAIFA